MYSSISPFLPRRNYHEIPINFCLGREMWEIGPAMEVVGGRARGQRGVWQRVHHSRRKMGILVRSFVSSNPSIRVKNNKQKFSGCQPGTNTFHCGPQIEYSFLVKFKCKINTSCCIFNSDQQIPDVTQRNFFAPLFVLFCVNVLPKDNSSVLLSI